MRLRWSAVSQKIRIWRLSSAGTGSASCRRASLPATTLRRSTQRSWSAVRETGDVCVSQFETPEYLFYGALSQAACCHSAASGERQQHLDAIAAHHKQLQLWAENCPENFENRAALVGAEIARLEGRELDAEHLYEQAIRSARENGFVHNEAIANELAARFYEARGFKTISHAYLQKARYCYSRWGATGKVRQIDKLYPQLREDEPASGLTRTIAASVEHLDLTTVIKVSQAVSGEIALEKLIDKLMRAAVEHAGAERGLLIGPRNDELQIEAEATTKGEDVAVQMRDGVRKASTLPESLVRVCNAHSRDRNSG